METEKICDFLENLEMFFATCFIISVFIQVCSNLCVVFLGDIPLAYIETYFSATPEEVGKIMAMTFAIWKLLIVQFTLVPALAAWTIKKLYKKVQAKKA